MGPLNTGSGFSPGGVTTLRVHIANRPTWPSSPAPAAGNYVYFTGYNNASNQPPPSLFITYILPVNPPSLVLPNPASFHTLTPAVQVSTTDPDGDAVNWYGYFITDSQGNQLWSSWVNSTGPQSVPAGTMAWNQTYTLTGCGWDGVDPYAVYPNGGVRCNSWPITPANQAPPTPAQASPPPGALVTATSSTTLSASAVTDPDGDPVSYDFQVFTNPAATGTPLSDSGAIGTASWTTPGLSDGTYYWRVEALDNTGDPSWAGPNPVVHDFAYDASGRVIASEVVGDPAWSCTAYDARGRVSTSSDSSGKTSRPTSSTWRSPTWSMPTCCSTWSRPGVTAPASPPMEPRSTP